MKLLIDSNVFLAALTAEPGNGPLAKSLLNRDYTFTTSLLNLMEVRTVLLKKEQQPKRKVQRAVSKIRNDMDKVIKDTPLLTRANTLQQKTYLYPMDTLIYSSGNEEGAVTVSFDSEMCDNGVVHPKYLV